VYTGRLDTSDATRRSYLSCNDLGGLRGHCIMATATHPVSSQAVPGSHPVTAPPFVGPFYVGDKKEKEGEGTDQEMK